MAVTIIPFVFPGIDNVRCAFQTRVGGTSAPPYASGNIGDSVGDDAGAVANNRESLRAVLGVDALVHVHQVHGKEMLFDPPAAYSTHAAAMPLVQADGIGLSAPHVGAMIKTADCQPVLLAHESGRYVAGLHVGWKGNRINFPAEGVQAFCKQYGVRPEELSVVRGPSLGPSNAEFVHFNEEWGSDFATWFTQHDKTMNLWQLTRDQLIAAGVQPERIYGLDLCTYALPESFFSYRRNNTTGRQASVIWMLS